MLKDKWKYGFTFFTRDKKTLQEYCLCTGSKPPTQYVAKYACKKSTHPFFYKDILNAETGEVIGYKWNYDIADKPFRLMSKNIGLGYAFSDHYMALSKLVNHPFSRVDPKILLNSQSTGFSIPRYYVKQLFKKQCVIDESEIDSFTLQPKTHLVTSSLLDRRADSLRLQSKHVLSSLESKGATPSEALSFIDSANAEKRAICSVKLDRVATKDFYKSQF